METFLDLLEKAKRSMVIYDDGDKVAGSIYDNPDVLEKVAAKLQKDSAFRIQCCFDCDDAKLGFRELLQEPFEAGQHQDAGLRQGRPPG